jgi:hypothetical protein
MPTYATLCELGTFQGHAGLDEVYELDGRLYGVVEEPRLGDLGRFYVYRWRGDSAPLEARAADPRIRWEASAA